MPLRKRQRRILLGLGFILGGVLLLWFSAPLWFPWVLRPLAREHGLEYSRYEREGYGRFALFGVSFTNQSARFEAKRVEALVPTLWLWRSTVERGAGTQPFLSAQGWRWESLPAGRAGKAVPGKAEGSVYGEFKEWKAKLPALERWLPVASLTNGTVLADQTSVKVPVLTWSHGKLWGKVDLPEVAQPVIFSANLHGPQPYELHLESVPLQLHSTIRLSTNQAGLNLQGTGLWRSNRVEFAAQFGPQGMLPQWTRLQARDFDIPAELLRLPGYRSIQGSLSGKWEHREFAFDLNAGARPLPDFRNLPPLKVDLHGFGNTNFATLQTARISSPWLRAELSRAMTVHFRGPLLREPARLQVAADLSRQPWTPLQGVLTGEADFVPTAAKFPIARFRLSGAGVGDRSLKAKTLAIEGNVDWPWLSITEARAGFEDGSTASASGQVELPKELVADGRFQFSGALARHWLPAGYGYQGLSVSGEFHGPLKELAHRGHLEATNFTSPYLQPLQLRAGWSGQEKNLGSAELVASAGASSLLARGALAIRGAETTLQLTNLSLLTNGQPVLELAEPCRVEVLKHTGPGKGWQVSASPFDWVGKGGEVHAQASVDWPREGALRLAVEKVSAALAAGFAKADLPEIEVKSLNARANWSNGPAIFGVELSAKGRVPAQPGSITVPSQWIPVAGELKLEGDQAGITLSNLVLLRQTTEVGVAHGFLPMTIHPGAQTNLVQLEAQKAVQFSVTALPQAFFWDELAGWAGVTLREPSLKLNLAGTWQAPKGEVALHAQRIQLRKALPKMPALEELQLTLQLDRQQARLTDGYVLVQRQPVTLKGEIPLGEDFWNGLKEKKFPDWKKASAHLQVEDADLAAFVDLFPKVLSPQGELSVDVSLLPGGKLDGELVVSRARTRPLETEGPLRDIEIQMKLLDRTLKLEKASVGVGGTTLFATGQADLRGTNWLKGALPPFQVVLSGTNAPLSRQSSSIIRSDLTLTVTKTNGAPPLIAGLAHLRDSYYLSDLTALVPGKVATPSKRPPYFSIEEPALAGWRLGVRVEGTRFLKVRSPIFNGEVSANLTVQGTLKDPIALGDLKIDSGAVRFPFASLEVQQGLVTLNSENPYRPQLLVTAASKQFGYDIKMEVTGPADAPVLQFTSTPPLASEQILLMVTAGELPRGEYTLSSQQKAQTLAMFLGRDLLSKLGYGDQAEQRLTIRSGEEISEQGRPTYHVEYKLSDRWFLEGEYDRFGDFNAGFKWRIYSK